jgi:hypothetical protein
MNRKGPYKFSKVSKILETLSYIFFLLPNFGLYKSYPLNRNLVLDICKKKMYTHIVSTHMHKQKSQHDA